MIGRGGDGLSAEALLNEGDRPADKSKTVAKIGSDGYDGLH